MITKNFKNYVYLVNCFKMFKPSRALQAKSRYK